MWVFNVERWLRLADDRLDCKIVACILPVSKPPTYHVKDNFHKLVLRDHPYVRLIVRHPRSGYTLAQRCATLCAVVSIQMITVTTMVGTPYPNPRALFRESTILRADMQLFVAVLSAAFATALNHWLSYLFTNAMPFANTDEDLETGTIDFCTSPFANQCFAVLRAGYRQTRAGGMVTCQAWRSCTSPRLLRKKKVDCLAREPPPPNAIYQFFKAFGWGLALLFIFLGGGAAIWIGLQFNDDRSWEYVCCLVGSLLMHVACLEPLKAVLISLIAGFVPREQPTPKGNKDCIVISQLRKPRIIDSKYPVALAKYMRRLNPAYRMLTPTQIELRHVNISDDCYRGMRRFSLAWSFLCLIILLTVGNYYRDPTSYYGAAVARHLFQRSSYGGIPSSAIVTYEE